MRRVLARFFRRFDESDHAWLDEQAGTIVGMVAADATEVHVAAYLRSVEVESDHSADDAPSARGAAVALWHIAKAALVRDFAERVLQGEVPVNEPTPDTFSHWVASKLLSPDELARFEAQLEEERDEPGP